MLGSMRKHTAERPSARAELAAWYRSALAEQERSGLSVADFAAQAGVTAATLYRWRHRLASLPNRHPAAPAGLVQVQVRPSRGRAGCPSAEPPPLIVRIGSDRSIEVPPGFDSEELARLIQALESC